MYLTPFSTLAFHPICSTTKLRSWRAGQKLAQATGTLLGGRVQEIWFTSLRRTRRKPYKDELPGAAHPRGADVWTNLGDFEA